MNDRKLEIICALGAIWWGIWVGNTWWETFTLAAAYTWMMQIAPEWFWGAGVGLIGILQLSMVLWNRCLLWRVAMALVSIFTWLLVTLAFVLGNWHTTGVVMYGMLTLIQTFIYIDNLTIWQCQRNGYHYVK